MKQRRSGTTCSFRKLPKHHSRIGWSPCSLMALFTTTVSTGICSGWLLALSLVVPSFFVPLDLLSLAGVSSDFTRLDFLVQVVFFPFVPGFFIAGHFYILCTGLWHLLYFPCSLFVFVADKWAVLGIFLPACLLSCPWTLSTSLGITVSRLRLLKISILKI